MFNTRSLQGSPRTHTLIKLKVDSPLTKLNQLFSAGIPTVAENPNLLVQQEECWELNPEGLSYSQIKEIVEIFTADSIPWWIKTATISAGVLVIPVDWVD